MPLVRDRSASVEVGLATGIIRVGSRRDASRNRKLFSLFQRAQLLFSDHKLLRQVDLFLFHLYFGFGLSGASPCMTKVIQGLAAKQYP